MTPEIYELPEPIMRQRHGALFLDPDGQPAIYLNTSADEPLTLDDAHAVLIDLVALITRAGMVVDLTRDIG